MHKRTAQLELMKITSVTVSSSCEIGDVNYFSPKSDVLAVQQEDATFFDDQYELSDYSIFNRQHAFKQLQPINITQRTFHHASNIHVGKVAVLGVSTSSMLQVGGLKEVDAEARVKHIRVLDSAHHA